MTLQNTRTAIQRLQHVQEEFQHFPRIPYAYVVRRFNTTMIKLETFAMSNKRRSLLKKVKFGETWFAQSHLDDSDLAAYEQWAVENEPDLPEHLNTLVGEYYSVKLSFDDYNDCYTASATCMIADSDNFGGIMTARSEAPYDALTMVLYKVLVLFSGQPWPKVDRRSKRG